MKKENLVNIKVMAERLGVTVQSLYKRIERDSNIPSYKIGGIWRFDEEEVLTYFKRATDEN